MNSVSCFLLFINYIIECFDNMRKVEKELVVSEIYIFTSDEKVKKFFFQVA